MKILGIDPGLVATGYGVISKRGSAHQLLEAGVIKTSKAEPLERRILKIYTELTDVLAEFKPDTVAVEDLYTHYNHPTTATLMGHARGVVFLAAAESGINVVVYAPTRLKKALTGNGRAGKNQVQRMVQSLLNIGDSSFPDHVSDALAAALCHANVMSREDLLNQISAE